MMSRFQWLSFAIAAVVALVLATHVFVAIDLLRFKIVQAPISAIDGEARTTVAASSVNGLTPPFALIGRISNPSLDAASFAVAVDGIPVCTPRIAGGRTQRFDCVISRGWEHADNHQLTIAGPRAGWSLEYLELATHHGGTSGDHDLVVLPSASTQYKRVPLVWAMAIAIAVFALRVFPRRPVWPRTAWTMYRIVSGVIVTLLILVQVSQWLSPYRVVLSLSAFLFWLAVVMAPWMWTAIGWFSRRPETAATRRHLVVRAAFMAAIVLLAFASLVNARLDDSYAGNYSGFLYVSERAFRDNPLLASREDVRRQLFLHPGGGYDGQFMYFAAFDPLLRTLRKTPERYRAVVDAPPYRFGRIGFVLLTLAFSGGQWQRFPITMIWLILGSLAVAAFVLALMAQTAGMTPATGLLVAAVPGFWQSLLFGLPEPIAAAGLLAGIYCVWHARWIAAAAFLALSLLVRETGIIAALAVLAAPALSDRRRAAVAVAGVVVGVLVLWRLYVMWALFADWGVKGLLFHPDDLTWPFAGFLRLWNAVGNGTYYENAPALSRAGIAYPALLIFALAIACTLVAARRTPVHVAAAAYALIAISLNYDAIWIHVGNGVRGTYESFLMLAVATTGFRRYSKTLQAGLVGFWICSAAYILFFSPDAGPVRSAIAIPF